jgi:hypothetical protein
MVETENYVISADEKVVLITDYDGRGKSVLLSLNEPKLKPSAPGITNPDVLQPSADVAFWGTDNLFPQNVTEEIEKSTILGPTLNFKVRALYGGGLIYGHETIDEKTGQETFIRKKDKVVEAFLKRSNINRYLLEATTDFYYFYNAFPELLLTADRKQIAAICAQEATFCRWSKQNEKTGLTDWALISGDWKNDPRGQKAKYVKAINPYWNAVEEIQNDRYFKYIYPISYPTPGKVQYQLAHWNAVRESGWLDVSQYIPEFKKHLFENQASIKYHIRINVDYWKWKYDGTWENFSADEKIAKRKEELKLIEGVLKGASNAGKTISSPYWCDADGKEHYYWDIITIDDKIQTGTYIEDSQEATSHLMYALEVDPVLPGHSPGSKMNNGGGSEKMIAFNIYLSLCEAHRDCILEPLNFIRDYNGWDPELVFKFKNNIVNAVDAGVNMKDMTASNNNSKPANADKNN